MNDINHWVSIAQGLTPLQMAQLTKKKRCKECGQLKPTALYTSDARTLDQLSPTCNDCKPDDTEHRKRKNKEWYLRYYAANRENILNKAKAYKERNREKIAELQRQWREKNPGKIRAYKARERQNRDQRREQERRYREKNREKIRERQRLWTAQNPEKIKLYNQRRSKTALTQQIDHDNPQHHENQPHVNTDQTAHF